MSRLDPSRRSCLVPWSASLRSPSLHGATPARRRRRGFTLVELLVTIAIIGVLVALLLPAVQMARESARRTTCSDHLRQVGIALHLHHDTVGYLPAGFESWPTNDGSGPVEAGIDPITWDGAPGWGWASRLLPYLEQLPLENRLDRNRPLWDPAHASVIEATLPILLCPSVVGRSDPFVAVDESGADLLRHGRPIRLGRSHYVANHGQESCWDGSSGVERETIVFTDIYAGATATVRVDGDTSRVADGPFFRNSRTTFGEVSDGLSNTIFIGEHSSRLSDKSWAGVVPGAYVHPRELTPENAVESAATLVFAHAGPSGGELDITGFPILHPINYPSLHVCQMVSDHPQGGLILFGDGSVRFVSEYIDLLTFAELSSMKEGEAVAW